MNSELSCPALVHDYLLVMRGAERTFAAIASCWPRAPIFTLFCDQQIVDAEFAGHAVGTSYLQRLRPGQSGFRPLMPLLPHATGRLPVGDYDLVLSSSSAFAHGVRTAPTAIHVTYCHSPFRYAWHEMEATIQHTPRALRPPFGALLRRIRRWDVSASQRVSHYVANSKLTQRRIQDYYGREATVIHPPVDVHRFHRASPEDFFLVVCEVVWHKRVVVAIEAARLAGQPLVVVGGGPDLKRLVARYGGQGVSFTGRIPDAELESLYARARALVVPNVEEFGIATVEAQASGRPVIAAAGGGVTETTIPGETSVLVAVGDAHALADAMRGGEFDRFSSERIRAHAARFSVDEFKRRYTAEVERVVQSSAAR